MDCTNKNCPAYAKCLAPYRGSRCKATRATYGLGDHMTNADRIKAMSVEEMAVFMAANQGVTAFDGSGNLFERWLDWLKQEVEE